MESKLIDSKNKVLNQNKFAIKIVMFLALFISISYLAILLPSFISVSLNKIDIFMFIKIFNIILAIVAVISCILCYNSTNKEEVFILSLVHIVFVIDILLGNIDNLDFINNEGNINDYIFIVTSILRITILLITILPFYKLKKLIIKNKFNSISSIILIVIFFSVLKMNNIINVEFKEIHTFIYYNIVLVIVYLIVAVYYLIKSLKSNECIYSVISASTFVFTVKWIYAIIGAINPSPSIKIISISVTYMGFIILILGVIWELIVNIKVNKELRQELVIFKKIADESKGSCILIYDDIGNIIYSNDSSRKYFYDSIDTEKLNLDKIVKKYRSEVNKDKVEEINKYISISGYWTGTIKNKNKDTTIKCLIQSIAIEGNRTNTVVMFNDISQRIREKKYLLEYEKMKNQEQVRNEFFANISHELRTPLNIFYSTIQLLDLKADSSKKEFVDVYKNYKKTLRTNCQRMLRLINNIVDITKIDVGFTKAEMKNYDIVRLVEDITLSVINYAKQKDINIVFDTEEEECVIKCDKDMIERAMLNLLSNAIKFTKINGNILVNVFVDEECVRIRVKDDGIGIPIEDQSYIFERFVQSDKSLTRLNEGSGIGLSIVNSIVQLHEGEIYVDSDGICGTEFEILLPNTRTDDFIEEEFYSTDNSKVELELSDIYELY